MEPVRPVDWSARVARQKAELAMMEIEGILAQGAYRRMVRRDRGIFLLWLAALAAVIALLVLLVRSQAFSPPVAPTDPPPTAEGRMMTVREVADRLAVGVETVAAWVQRGELRALLVSGSADSRKRRYRVGPADLEAFIAARTVQPPRPRTRKWPRSYERIV